MKVKMYTVVYTVVYTEHIAMYESSIESIFSLQYSLRKVIKLKSIEIRYPIYKGWHGKHQ